MVGSLKFVLIDGALGKCDILISSSSSFYCFPDSSKWMFNEAVCTR